MPTFSSKLPNVSIPLFRVFVIPDLIRDLLNKNKTPNRPQAFIKKHPNISFLLLLISLTIISFGALRLFQTEDAAAWYHDNWAHRTKITFGNTGSAVTNQKIKLDLDTSTLISAGKMQSDCGDSRFTDKNGNELQYYINTAVGDCNTSSTDYYVLIPTINNGTNTIYHYYGNTSATNGSDSSLVTINTPTLLSQSSSISGSTSQTSNSISPSANSLLVVIASNGHGNTGDFAPWGISDTLSGTSSWTIHEEIDADVNSSFGWGAMIATAQTSSSPGSGTVTVTATSGNRQVLQVLEVASGFNTTTPVAQSQQNSNSNGATSQIVTLDSTPTFDSLIIGGISVQGDTDNVLTAGTGFTQLAIDNASTGTSGNTQQTQYDMTNADTTIDWTGIDNDGNDDGAVAVAIEINQTYLIFSPTSGPSLDSEQTRTLGPLAHWTFNETSGNTIQDSTANNNDATNSGATRRASEFCISQGCLQFDGANDVATVSNTVSGIKTVSFWTRPNTATEYFIDLNGSAYIQSSSGTLSATGFTSPTIYVNGIETTTITTNDWNYVTVTTDTAISGSAIKIGQISTNYLQGFIDEVRLYPDARTADQISQDYNNGAVALGSGPPDEGGGGGLSQGLVAYYPMEETAANGCPSAGYDSCDKSGLVNDLFWAGSLATTYNGKFGNGITFDGTGDYAQRNTDFLNGLKFLDNFTWAFWYRPTSISANYNLLTRYRGVNGGIGYRIYQSSNGSVRIDVSPDGTTGNLVTIATPASVVTTRWNHVIVTHEDGKEIKIYVNGQLQTTQAYTGGIYESVDYAYENYSHLTLGTDCCANTYFNGQMDEVRIYNRVLDQNESLELYKWAPGPIANWKFEEGTGTTTYDQTSNGNNGSLSNDFGTAPLPQWQPGRWGNAVHFDGVDDFVEVNSVAGDIGRGSVSVTTWFKLDQTHTIGGGTRAIFMLNDGPSDNDFWLYLSSVSGLMWFDVYTGSGWGDVSSIQTSWAADTWYHVAAVLDNADGMKLYINGVLQGTDTNTARGTSSLSSFAGIGRNNGESWHFPKGLIDETKVYRYGLTAEQVLEDMNAGHPAVGTPIGSTVLHLSMDEGYGTTANDKSPQGNNGTISGASWTNEGKLGKALSYDGSNDYVSIPDNDIYSFGNGTNDSPFSISAWAKPADMSRFRILAKRDEGVAEEWILGTDSSEKLEFVLMDGTAANYIARSYDTVLSENNWYHIIGTYDGGGSATGIKIYVNGVRVDDTTATNGSYVAMENTANDLYIGGQLTSGSFAQPADGLIDELKIYPFALTADQVATDYNQAKQTILGSTSTDSSGNPDNSDNRKYCIPGDTSTCSAPVLEMNFENVSGTTYYDISGNNYNATANGGPLHQSSGHCQSGRCLEFDGNDDYLQINGLLGSPTNITVSAWVNLDAIDTEGSDIISIGDYVTLRADSPYASPWDGVMGVYYRGSSNWNPTDSGEDIINTGWHHLTYVVNDTSNSQTIYIDGQPQGSTTHTQSISYSGQGTNTFIATHGNSEAIYDTGGLIDQVRVYDYARTPAQIAWDYNQGAPIAHYKFDECSGTTAYDASGNGNNGTITPGGVPNSTAGTCSSGSSSEMWANGTVGKWNASLDFDGSDDYITIPDSQKLRLYDYRQASFSFWYKTDQHPVTSTGFIQKQNIANDQDGYSIWADNSTGRLRFSVAIGGIYTPGDNHESSDGYILNDDQWHQYTVTWIYNTTDGLKFYRDGQLDSQTDSINLWAGDNTGSLYIGKSVAPDLYLPGQLDDVRIYNYPLTAQQVKMIHNNGAINFQ